MTAADQARIRRSATRRFIMALVLLPLMSLYLFYFSRSDLGELFRLNRNLDLSRQSLLLAPEFFRYWAVRGIELSAFPPPAAGADRTEWARQIQAHLGAPVPVFVAHDGRVSWAAPPAESALADSAAAAILAEPRPNQPPMRELGSLAVRLTETQQGGDPFSIWIVERKADGLRWGALVHMGDEWLAFFRELATPGGEMVHIDGPAFTLNGVYALPTSSSPELRVGLRATAGDSVLFESPGLKAGADSLRQDMPAGPTVEFFTAPHDLSYVQERLLKGTVPWALTVLPLVFLLPLYRGYRQVRLLTEPEPAAPEPATVRKL